MAKNPEADAKAAAAAREEALRLAQRQEKERLALEKRLQAAGARR